MKKCYSCGADVPDESKFCPKCGKPIKVTQDLIDRAKANDSDAQTELYERTYKTVYSRIRAKVPDDDTAMDIMQEVYLNAFTNLDQLQTPESFPSWLLTIASRQVCAWYRKNGKENENVQMSQLEYENDDTISDEDDLLEQPEYREDFSPDESLDRAETGRLLSEILDTLPEDQRIILTMRYYDEMSLQEISDELGVNLSTVKTRLTAGKKKVEAKVLELEKSGTKLYSLGPVAFLVFLLHHMELFAPEIPANTIIGLTAAGAGGATAAHVTAGAAAKAAVVTAAKGVSVKVIAIVAAAVVVVGGGVTAGVLIANNQNPETAEVSETPAATETPEPSESQEPAETEEPSETPTPEPIPDPPSTDAVYNMTAPLSDWMTIASFGNDVTDSSVGTIYLDTNQAVELAGLAAYYDNAQASINDGDYENAYVSDLTADQVETYLKRMFGSQFNLSDFTNTAGRSEWEEYGSAFSTDYPDYSNLWWLHRTDDGNFYVDVQVHDNRAAVTDVSVKSVDLNEDESTCTATVQYDLDDSFPAEGYYDTWSLDLYFNMIPDEEAEYGWAITSITFGDKYNEVYETVPAEAAVYNMVNPLTSWAVWAYNAASGSVINPTLNQAAELAAYAYFWESGAYSNPDFGTDPNGPVINSYILPEAGIEESLKNRFGSGYNLSDFTNTVSPDGLGFGGSSFTSAFEFSPLEMMLCKINGQYELTLLATDGISMPDSAVISSIEKNNAGENKYTATVEYNYFYYGVGDYDETTGYTTEQRYDESVEVVFELSPDSGSTYGWVITQIRFM